MPVSTAACAVCGNVQPLRLMRFNRPGPGMDYEYQCSSCRLLLKQGVSRDEVAKINRRTE